MSLRPQAPVIVSAPERDERERLSADDLSSVREQEFLDAALAEQRRRAAATTPQHTPGRCSNCGARVKKTLTYCDSDCRDDHQRRERALARR